ncbi:myb-like protein X isoform X2 [Osmia bicornis bicornis]|uniref:myb-like protein X isoform X2 n=1 Tax=Osmia bicornis bicornis TaxID=1437191 RepID=UPI001EAEAFB4|nr:myb-like protein X isoform X2 [Osmia bicornis bicornis]
MPRSTRDSEEEVDPKPGRKTRLTDVVSVDSPLRRSSRIKSVKQNESSPESLSSDTSNVSNTQTKVTRRRTGIMDNTTTTEKQRSLRSRMNSGSLDVSEVTENGTNTMTPTKRNRNSITGDVLNKTNNRRSTQFTRAGSESKTSPIRVTRNTRSTSMEPESVAVNKYMDKNESECVHTSSRMRRRTLVVPSEATVVEEKEENMKVVVVKLDRTLPNVSEVKEMDLNDPLKSAQKHDPMSSAEDNLNSSCQSLNEKSIENSSETPTELKEVPIKEEESANDSSTLKSKPTEKSGSDEQNFESIQETCNKNQRSEVIEGNDSDITATNSLQDIPATEWKEKNVANDSVFEIRNTEDMKIQKKDAFDYTSELAVEIHSLSEPMLNASSDKNVPLKISSDLSSCESIELVQCMDDVMTTDDEKLTETSLTLNKETTKVHNEESNEIVNDSTISNIEKTISANEESGKDNIKSNTSMNDKDDIKKEVHKPDTLGNVQNDYGMSCTNTCSSPNSTNTVPLTSPDKSSTANPECSPILKNKETSELKSINKTNTSFPNTNSGKSSNADQDSVTDVVKSSPPVTVTEPAVTPTEHDEKVPKKGLKEEESTNDLSTLKKKLTEKSGSDEQKSESIQETCNKNQESEAVESNDSDKIATNLFQDIPDVEWKEKNSAKSTNTDGDSVTDVVKSSAPFTVTETPTELDEEVTKKEELKEKEFANDSSTLKNKPTEKSGSDEQKSESIQETCNKNKGSEAVESNDSDTTATDLFQDIPAAEWNEKNTDVDKNSIHLVSTEQLENEMEAECDLVLIDKEASENMKAAREKEASDYDSDESVVLKLRLDSVIAQKNEKTKMNKSVDKMNDSKDATSNENDIDNETTNTKDLDEIENKNQDTSITEQRTEHSASSRKLRERKRSNESHKITEAEENLSESITKKQKPLNKSTSKADVSRKSLNKSIQKEMESESTSAKKSKEKQSLNISSKKQRSCIEESDTEAKDSSISEKKSNAKKKFSRKRSTIRTIQSNSDDNNSESGDSANIELPKFMLDEASNTGSNESDKSMDSDIEKEYNLGGKDTSKFSDDDVRGDECRASETESSDPEDNGSDLEDFIVDDVEEDEESEEEGEKANEKIEIEELHTDENTRENQEKEIKEQDEAMQVQEPDVIEDKIKEGITEEELQNENEQENIEDVDKLINTSSKQKSKLEISDRLSRSQTNRKKKLKKVDTSQSEKSEKENNLSDLSLKQKVLSVADNILEVDRQKKRKKRKQSAEKNNTTILIEDSFLEDIDSQIVSKDKNVVSTIDADKNKKVEKVFLNEKKKRQKITHTDINKDVEEEVLHEEITDTKTKITKKPKKIKKKQEKEITENVPDICSGNQVLGKKKKKISEPLLNEEITTTRISKKTPKLSKDIVLQDDETAVEQLPKKKKKLLSKDASSQEKVLAKTLDKKQNLSSNDTSQNKNISAEKLSKKQNKLVEKVANSEVKPVKKSIKLQQSVSDSNEGPTIVKFSEVREEALKAVKRITDGIKVTKEKKNKKQKERMQEVELENEKPKSKKQKIIDNKTTSTKGIKRLSDEFLENLSDVPSKPLKKKKLSEIKNQTLPSRSMFDSRANKVENVYVEEDFDTVSSYGGTTQFAVENIQKMKKKKKIPGVVSFKQKMIARNSRQPVSAYLMYLEKQKIAGKDTFCNKPY